MLNVFCYDRGFLKKQFDWCRIAGILKNIKNVRTKVFEQNCF